MRDRSRVLALLGLGGIAVLALLIVYLQHQPSQDKPTVSAAPQIVNGADSPPKKEINPGLTERTAAAPVTQDDKVVIIGQDSPKPIQAPTVPEVVVNTPSSKPSTPQQSQQTDTQSLWAFIVDTSKTKEERTQAVTKFKESFSKNLQTGNVPPFVNKNVLLMTSEEDSGFTTSMYSFPNATLELVTVVLPNIVANEQRTILYTILTQDKKVTLTAFEGLDIVSTEKSVSVSNGVNYVQLAGAKLNKQIFKSGEITRMVALKVSTNNITTIPFDNSVNNIGVVTQVDSNNVLTIDTKNPSHTPFVYTESETEGSVPNRIHLVLTTEQSAEKMFDFVVKDGKSSLVFVKDVK